MDCQPLLIQPAKLDEIGGEQHDQPQWQCVPTSTAKLSTHPNTHAQAPALQSLLQAPHAPSKTTRTCTLHSTTARPPNQPGTISQVSRLNCDFVQQASACFCMMCKAGSHAGVRVLLLARVHIKSNVHDAFGCGYTFLQLQRKHAMPCRVGAVNPITSHLGLSKERWRDADAGPTERTVNLLFVFGCRQAMSRVHHRRHASLHANMFVVMCLLGPGEGACVRFKLRHAVNRQATRQNAQGDLNVGKTWSTRTEKADKGE